MRRVTQVLGQDRAFSLLQACLQSGRLHHAYIFYGPQGVGKSIVARWYAKTLLCLDAQPDFSGQISACGACASCKLLDAMDAPVSDDDADARPTAHPDLHLVNKELARFSDDAAVRQRKLLNIPVDVIETHLLEPAYLAPTLGKRKVFIVDEAELIDPVGQNKLLKTLEEPTPGTFIILVSSSQDRLLATIRSRCQQVPFAALSAEVIDQWAKQHASEWSADERAWLARFSGGSLGRAAMAVEYDLRPWGKTVIGAIEQISRTNYPARLGKDIHAFIEDLAARWVDNHDNASKDAANKMASAMMWSMITQHARAKLAAAAATLAPGDFVSADAALLPWTRAIDAVSTVESETAANVNLSLACDHFVSLLFRAMTSNP